MRPVLTLLMPLLAMMLHSNKAPAEVIPELREDFGHKMNLVQSAIAQEPNGLDGPFFLQDINLDIILSVSFGVPGVLNLTVSPEIDFIFVPTEQSAEETTSRLQ